MSSRQYNINRQLFYVILAIATCCSLTTARIHAANLLSNAGLEYDAQGPNQNFAGWQTYGQNAFSETSVTAAHTGSNYFKVYQAFNGQLNYTGIYQDYISGPGAVYQADGWAFTANNDVLAGNNVSWLEVTFRDTSANILALYRSALINTNGITHGGFPKGTWADLDITNQYDPGTYQITNTTAKLTAPPGTAFVRFQIVFQGDAQYSAGSVYFDDLNLTQVSVNPYGNMNIVWSDEFNDTTINHKLWTYDTGNSGWGNNELEYYTTRTNNAYEAGGCLHIIARNESYNGANYTSARLKSEGLFSWKCGRFEWRARLPAGVAYWPALWLLGTNIATVGWPGCGEIDVMENNGSHPDTVQGSLHSGSDETGFYHFLGNESVTNFHIYTLDWNTNAILFYVDGHLYENQTTWSSSIGNYPFPFDQPFFVIMNLAIGGNYLGNPSPSAISAGTQFPGEMAVDYVRIYEATAPLQLSLKEVNSQLVLSWPSNIVCHLQGQTNMLARGLTTNWLSIPITTNHIQIAPTAGSAYYRLTTP